MEDILKSIIKLQFQDTEYYRAKYVKTQIVLHHTVSNGSAQAVADYWASLKNRVGTCIVIDKKGNINQLFSSAFYAGHIGNVAKEMQDFNLPNRSCSATSIGVELINMGALNKANNKLIDAYGNVFTGGFVYYETPYRGYNYFAKYTNKQIESLKLLLIYLGDKYDVPTAYNKDMWDVNKDALSGVPGVYTHTSFRYGKSDLHPQTELIDMLKTL